MMGKQSAPEELFYRFRLEDQVPGDHLLRALDAALNFERVRTVLADYYSHTGRPSIDPELIATHAADCLYQWHPRGTTTMQ